jgi:ATP-dependent Lhr-like helicase
MTDNHLQRLADILTTLEDRELPLLSWGVTDTALTDDEVHSVLSQAVSEDLISGVADGPREDEYLSALTTHALLHRVPGSSPPRYRTRLAEGMRLLARQSQLFPPTATAPRDWWPAAPPLVADYRLHVEPRRYPRRDIAPDDTITRLAQRADWSPLHAEITRAMLDGRDLSAFQVAAAEAILTAAEDARGRGLIIGAGTGSGKTLAFYLPAMLSLAPNLRPGHSQVEVLALYPRKELLRDQARDGADFAVRTAPVLKAQGRRPVRIGLLYGDTPYRADDARIGATDGPWSPLGNGTRCPYFPCPNAACGGDLVWSTADRQAGIERLRCERCGLTLDAEQVTLTRQSLAARPPDILFTTTEMLSRNATDRATGGLLGWFGSTGPRLVLLDEVHTYAGVHGAQIALLLRRWRNSLRLRRLHPPVMVGLSATLRDAVPFFSTLTGLGDAAIEYISPAADDLVPTGRQYSVVLRGDPVSGTSILSTTLQTAMLMGRLLDPPGVEGMYGSSGFVFTDDLDVTNRLYDDLRDAEGGQSRRMRPGPTRKPVLAQLRSPQFSHAGTTRAVERYRDGQAWPLITEIGRSLTGALNEGALRIGRTSSQDAGVDAEADLIVATASLEVGFNDSRVGLMLQHKAPHDAAAFIQRRGRAGRSPAMRPWTAVVLSDYGRDRITYQGYEQLFYPDVSAQHLPVHNRFVLKIQATHALLDWLSREASRGGPWVDARRALRSPRNDAGPATGADRVRQVLTDLLDSPGRQDELASFLEQSLTISAAEAQAVLWEEPRSLLLAVVPTARRRLDAQWQTVDGLETEPGDLLPEFITRALFDPLDLPDVALQLPFPSADENRMPILATLREAVPGRVSRRFGVRRDEHRTWIEPPASGILELDQLVVRGIRLGEWTPDESTYQIVRPLEIALTQPSQQIKDASQATPRWRSQFILPTDAAPAPVPEHSRWADLVTDVRFAAHVSGSPLEVRRMTPGADGELLLPNGVTQRTRTDYTVNGQPAALGFALTVDGLVIDVTPLDHSDPAIGEHLRTPGWRTLAFQTLVNEDAALEPIANAFQRGWLTLIYLTAYGVAAINSAPDTDLTAALANGAWARDIGTILAVVYRSADPNNPALATPARLTAALTDLAADSVVRDTIDRHALVLSQPDPAAATWPLAERAYVDTLAAAVRETVTRIVPDAQDSDLITDVIATSTGHRILLTETSNGGLGLIEQLRTSYTRDFRRFWNLVEHALGPSDYEAIDRSLRLLLHDAATQPDGAIAQALSAFRSANDTHTADQALTDLRRAWNDLAGPPQHLAVAALASRFLRPGSSPDVIIQVRRLLAAWDDLETRCGAELDARVIAYTARQVDEHIALTPDQVFSLLWPRGSQARNRHLQHWQPYEPSLVHDRLLAHAVVSRAVPAIDVTQPGWTERYRNHLATVDTVDLHAPSDHRAQFADAIRHVGTVSIDRGPLRVYGHLGRVVHAGRSITARISVTEAEQ